MNLIKLLLDIIATFFNTRTEVAQEAWDERDWFYLVMNILLMAAVMALGIGVPLILIYRFRRTIMALLTPVLVLAVLIASFFDNKKSPSAPSAPMEDIETVRSRAKATYPTMKQTAYLLFRDLCRYLPGLVSPFSLSAVTAPVAFDITASLVTQFHFVVARGQCDAPIDTLKEILETLIDQHLQAKDLPISIPAIYTAADGTTWPGLVVDGVYDLGSQYRVDLVITNDAEVTALKAKGLSWFDDDTDVTPHDPDFD